MSPADPSSGQPRIPARPLALLFIGVFLLTCWCVSRGWHASILDRHEFRQLQTALTTWWVLHDGPKLAYATPLFGPPWSIPMEFPIYEWVVAGVSRATGFGLESVARGVSLFFFLACLPAVYALAGFAFRRRSLRMLAVTAVLASPTYLFYARTVMIETTALAFAVWFLYALGRAVRDQSGRWAATAAILATLAALAKVTTFLIFCPPAAALALWFLGQRWRLARGETSRLGRVWRSALLAAIPVAVALLVGYAWVRYSDHVKSRNPFTEFLTSSALDSWNWGTWAQRVSPKFWSQFWDNVSQFVLGEASLCVLLLAAVFADRACRWLALAGTVTFLVGTLLFSNLFFFHDYYYSANAIFLLAGAGALLVGVWRNPRLPGLARWAFVLLFLGGQYLIYDRGYADYARRTLPQPPPMARLIQKVTPADGVLVIYGWGWNPLLPYYAQRRAILIRDEFTDDSATLDRILARLPAGAVTGILVHSDALKNSPEFIRSRTTRFNLAPEPVVSGPIGDLYLARADLPVLLAHLREFQTPGLNLRVRPADFLHDPALTSRDLAPLNLAMLQPRPYAARGQFAFSDGLADGRPVLNANAPSQLWFKPPPQARSIHAEVGLPPAAYSGGPAVSDGVTVEIYEVAPDQTAILLFQQTLDPARRAEDRPPLRITLKDIGPFTGDLVFRITPGPAGNPTNDWSYWSRIDIE